MPIILQEVYQKMKRIVKYALANGLQRQRNYTKKKVTAVSGLLFSSEVKSILKKSKILRSKSISFSKGQFAMRCVYVQLTVKW